MTQHAATRDEIRTFLFGTIAQLTDKPELEHQLSEDASIQETGMDSVRIINLVVQIEAEYDIAFEDEELLIENFETVSKIKEQVVRKLNEAS